MNEKEISRKILIHLYAKGPNDKYGPTKLSQALNFDFEQVVDSLYSLSDKGLVTLTGIERRDVFLAQITGDGRQLAQEEIRSREAKKLSSEKTASSSEETTSSHGTFRETWLAELGFVSDPFLTVDGGKDEHITDYFYTVDYFVNILGEVDKPEVTLVFGAEGSGKSSLRQLVRESYRGEGALPVIYTDFRRLLIKQKKGEQILLIDHVKHITKMALSTILVDINNGRTKRPQFTDDDRRHRNRLWLYVLDCEDDFIAQELRSILIPDEQLAESLNQDAYEYFRLFVWDVTALFGYYGFCVLVDPDYDILEDLNVAWNVLKPLLEALGLLEVSSETPKVRIAFKFFLDQRFRDLALEIYWVRQREKSRVFDLKWPDQELRELLQHRLASCSGGQREKLEKLAPEAIGIDDLVVQLAEKSPRELIAICNNLFSLYCSTQSRRLEIWREISNDPLIPYSIVKKVLEPYEVKRKESEIENLLGQDESHFLEFKSTLCYSTKDKKRDKELEKVVARALCGFMNAQGGKLVIGVDDRANVLGLDSDISVIRKKDEDGFQLTFTDIVTENIDSGILTQRYWSLSFESYQSKRICVIEIMRSEKPVFFRDGENSYEFYVRSGNSTRKLNLKDAIEYVEDHFWKTMTAHA